MKRIFTESTVFFESNSCLARDLRKTNTEKKQMYKIKASLHEFYDTSNDYD